MTSSLLSGDSGLKQEVGHLEVTGSPNAPSLVMCSVEGSSAVSVQLGGRGSQPQAPGWGAWPSATSTWMPSWLWRILLFLGFPAGQAALGGEPRMNSHRSSEETRQAEEHEVRDKGTVQMTSPVPWTPCYLLMALLSPPQK